MVGEACWAPILLSATSIVGLAVCTMQRKVPAIICTRVMPHLSSFGEFVVFGEYCTFDPYVGESHLWGECLGHRGMRCWKRSRALRIDFDMEMLT